MNENVTVDVVTDSHSFHNLYEHKNLVGKRSVSARLIWFHLRGQHKTESGIGEKRLFLQKFDLFLCVCWKLSLIQISGNTPRDSIYYSYNIGIVHIWRQPGGRGEILSHDIFCIIAQGLFFFLTRRKEWSDFFIFWLISNVNDSLVKQIK